jgi:hypothetical protein
MSATNLPERALQQQLWPRTRRIGRSTGHLRRNSAPLCPWPVATLETVSCKKPLTSGFAHFRSWESFDVIRSGMYLSPHLTVQLSGVHPTQGGCGVGIGMHW